MRQTLDFSGIFVSASGRCHTPDIKRIDTNNDGLEHVSPASNIAILGIYNKIAGGVVY